MRKVVSPEAMQMKRLKFTKLRLSFMDLHIVSQFLWPR